MFSASVAASFGVVSALDADAGGYEEVSLDTLLVAAPERTIILKVTGHSMIDDGIEPGSFLVVETPDTSWSKSWLEPHDRENVIALIGGSDLTVKKFRRTDKGESLEPRNCKCKQHKPLPIARSDRDNDEDRAIKILGIVRAVVQL
jgi:SOS-response transcriptional repressor LexA